MCRARDGERIADAGNAKADVVKLPRHPPVFYLGLGHRSLKIHVPHGGSFYAVYVAFPPEIEEAALRGSAASPSERGVALPGVDALGAGVP